MSEPFDGFLCSGDPHESPASPQTIQAYEEKSLLSFTSNFLQKLETTQWSHNSSEYLRALNSETVTSSIPAWDAHPPHQHLAASPGEEGFPQPRGDAAGAYFRAQLPLFV